MSKYWYASGIRRGIRKETGAQGTFYNTWNDALGKRTLDLQTYEYVVCDMFTTTELPDLTNAANIKYEIYFWPIPTGATIGLLPNGFSFNVNSATFNTIKGLSSYVTNSGGKMEISKPQLETIISRGLGYHYNGDQVSVGSSVCEITITYNDLNAKAIIQSISPHKKIIIGNDDNILSWTYTQDAGLPQTHYDLQISSNNGVTWTTLANKLESSSPAHVILGGTLATGNYLWRVRVYTRDGNIVSDWATGEFTVRNNPSTSNVYCNSAPMPTIEWAAIDQQAYQVRMGNYDSGAIYSDAGDHIIPRYYADGVYNLSVRTQAAGGAWSVWSEPIYVEIKNQPAGAIELNAFVHERGIGLTWDGGYNKYYVIRDGVPIAKVTGENAYYDALAYREHEYKILAPIGGGYYDISNTVLQGVSLPYDLICEYNTQLGYPELSWIPLKQALNSMVMRSYGESKLINYREFAGREYPVAFVSEHKTHTVSLQYAFASVQDVEAVERLLGKLVVFKDRRGGRLIGTMDTVTRTITKRFYNLAFSITQVDFVEDVGYDTTDIDL